MNKYGKLIGSGSWSKAYRLPNSDFVTIVTNDYAKEALDLYTPCNIHLPAIEQVDSYTNRMGNDMKVYRMPFYERLKMTQLERQDAKDLRTIRKTFIAETGSIHYYSDYNVLADIVDSMDIQETMKEGLNSLLSGLANYSYRMGLEFYPRNLKMQNHRLILLDVIFTFSY